MKDMTEAIKFIPLTKVGRDAGLTTAVVMRACNHHRIPVVQCVPRGRRMLTPADYEQLLGRIKGGKRD